MPRDLLRESARDTTSQPMLFPPTATNNASDYEAFATPLFNSAEYTEAVQAGLCAGRRHQSMGRTGCALNNAVAESFRSTPEFELLAQQRFTTARRPATRDEPGTSSRVSRLWG
jgi:hypothetical protein